MKKKIALVVSCEHAVDTVPDRYIPLFKPYSALLKTHRGIDFGTLAIAEAIKEVIPCDFVQATATRLLIDCNRSLHIRGCFSEVTHNLSVEEKDKIISTYYLPFREQVMAHITKHREQGLQVLHCSIHSFTPVMNNHTRTADIGLLYDPKRPLEKALCQQWKNEIKKQNPLYRIKMNYPYQGTSDGFTTSLRKIYTQEEYLGIEIESNQALTQDKQSLENLKKTIKITLSNLLND